MIPPRTLVREKRSGMLGIVCPSILPDGQAPLVVFAGTTSPVERAEESLDVLGMDTPIADERGCGAGLGNRCCIFLSFNPASRTWECLRFGERHWAVIRHHATVRTTAQRVPIAFSPDCQPPPPDLAPAP